MIKCDKKEIHGWSDCETVDQIKNYLRIFADLAIDDIAGIKNITGCKTPCTYFEYLDCGKKVWRSDVEPDFQLGFAISFASTEVTVKEEVLIYPITSFLAEVGGSLGMFLGFSLLMVWDVFSSVIEYTFLK